MRRLVVQQWISLDGHASDKDGRLDFFAPRVREIYQDAYYETVLQRIDCILMGRKTYDLFSALWPDRLTGDDFLARKINTEKKIVFSNTLTTAPWGKWNPATIEKSDPVAMITSLKSMEGKDMVIWGSVALAQLVMRENLVDDYYLHVCPIITGDGRKLIPQQLRATSLTLLDSRKHDNGIVSLHYQTQ